MKFVVNEIRPEKCFFRINADQKCMAYNGRCVPDMIVSEGRIKECGGCITADWLSELYNRQNTLDMVINTCPLIKQTDTLQSNKDKLNQIYGEPKGENNG